MTDLFQIEELVKEIESLKKRVAKLEAGPTGYTYAFNKFWQAYPNKTAKAAAFKKWKSHKCEAIADQVVRALKAQVKQPQWVKDNGQFVPHAATWLNQQRWEDEIVQETRYDAVTGRKLC